MRGRSWLVAAAVLAAATACTSGDANTQRSPQPASSASGGAVPAALATPGSDAPIPGADRLQPLTGLGPCDDPPAAAVDDPVQGLVLPDEAVLLQVTDADPLTNVQGYVEMTPVQVRAFYQRHPEATVVSVEDEGFEAEVLFEADDRRVFVKAQAVCELGSVFVAIVSPTAP